MEHKLSWVDTVPNELLWHLLGKCLIDAAPEVHDEENSASASDIQEKCNDYLNYSAFLARCTGAGLYENDKNKTGYKYCTYGIADGVEKDLSHGNIRKARILVAANYILLSGQVVRDYCHNYPSDSDRGRRAREMWNAWKQKFEKIADGQDEDYDIKDAAKRAHAVMVELDAPGPDAPETAPLSVNINEP